jgi:hypothetical protein
MLVLGGLLAVAFAFLFYKTAESKSLPAIPWAVAGLVSFYVPNFLWQMMVAKPKLQALHMQNPTFQASFWGFSSVAIGAVCAFLVWRLVLSNKAKASE